jgi:hypothetical protein
MSEKCSNDGPFQRFALPQNCCGKQWGSRQGGALARFAVLLVEAARISARAASGPAKAGRSSGGRAKERTDEKV